MKSLLNLAIILVAVALCQPQFAPSHLVAEEDLQLTEIRELMCKVDSLIDARQFDTAIVLGELALEKAQERFGDSDTSVARALHLLGRCYYDQGNYAECESVWSKALGIRESTLEPEHPDIATSLHNLGLVYWDQGRYTEAEPVYKQALDIRQKTLGPDHPEVATTLNNLGLVYWDQGRYTEAEPLYKQALDIRQKTLGPDHPEVATTLNNLGLVYWDQGRYAEAEPLYKQALDIRQKTLGPDHPEVAQSLNNLGLLYWSQGIYAEAESLYKQALDIRQKTLGPNHPEVAQSLNNLALLYWDQGRYAEAEPLYKQALDIRQKTLGPDHSEVAQSLNNLALLYWDQGRYAEAEPLYKQALGIRQKTLGPDHPEVAITLNNLGLLYWDQGICAEAELLYKQALDIKRKVLGPGHPDVATTLNNLGLLYRKQGRYAEAESVYKQALDIRQKTLGSDNPGVAITLNNLGVIYQSQGKYTEAEPLFKQAFSIMEEVLGLEHPKTALSLKNLAVLYSSLGEVDKSLKHYVRLQQSRQHLIDYLFSYASEEQKMRYLEEYPLIEHSLISFAITAAMDESERSAFEMVLKGKAAVIDAMSAEREIAYCPYNDEILSKVEEHTEICSEISTLALAGVGKLQPEIYRGRLSALYSRKDSLEAELSSNCSEFKDELAAKKFAISDVVKALPEGVVLWEFIRYNPYDFGKVGNYAERTGLPRYAAFTLDGAGNITLTDLGDAGRIDNLVNLAREEIYRARSEVYSPLAAESEERLGRVTGDLYDLIFSPLELSLGTDTNIIISPDGQLSLVPFEILLCPDGRYAIEKFRISYLSSGRDLLRFKKEEQPSDRAFVLADPDFNFSGEAFAELGEEASEESSLLSFAYEPSRGISDCLSGQFNALPYGREEAASVVEILKRKADLEVESYYGEYALEEVLKRMTTAPRVLHLVTHGYFCSDLDLAENKMLENPLLRSGLALAGANRIRDRAETSPARTEDGVLTAFEVSGLNLVGTELVTLSACESGLGQVKNGEGVYGLRRAFQHAGTRTIVMSLWKVPDKETCELMELFYETWLSGESKSVALREAALSVLSDRRKSGGSAHPLFWGGFVLAGDPE